MFQEVGNFTKDILTTEQKVFHAKLEEWFLHETQMEDYFW